MSIESEKIAQKILELEAQNSELKARLAEAEETLRAISSGEVDALVVYSESGERVYTLTGADYAYRVMVESIHEGAANIASDGTILYCNRRLAEMAGKPLEKVLGTPFFHLLPAEQTDLFRGLVASGLDGYETAEFLLVGAGGESTPVLITGSAAEVDGHRGVCLVITDLTEQKRAAARERELKIRVMKQREEERLRIARNLHDGPIQDLLGLSYQVYSMIITPEDRKESDLTHVRENILAQVRELRNACNDLRPPNAIQLSLAKAIRYHSQEIMIIHPEITIEHQVMEDGDSLPMETRTAIFRILQESMNNILRHSHADLVKVSLTLDEDAITLDVNDNGKGFELPDDWLELARKGHLGLVGMRERADEVNGKLLIRSSETHGTQVQVIVPYP